MHSLFSTWTGFFYYDNEKMPEVETTITFERVRDNEFRGFLSENLLILPDDFRNAIDVKGQKFLTAWGSVAGKISEGEFHSDLPDSRKDIRFIKTFDQLSGYPVACRAGFNMATGLISGHWGIIEGNTRCDLPLNLKKGHFTLHKPEDGGRPSFKKVTPIKPELLHV